MIEAKALGRHISEIVGLVGAPIVVPHRPPEGDPEYGLARYLTFPDRGFNIRIDWNDVADCVQFYGAQNDEGYTQYAGALPRGLTFKSTRSQVRSALGEPQQHHEGGGKLLGRKILPWDSFVCEGRKLHLQYREAFDGILLVSVMPLPAST